MLKIHKDFIENLSVNIQYEEKKELWIRSQFYDYTQHILDYNIHNEHYEFYQCKMLTQEITNTELLQYYLIKDHHKSISNDVSSKDLHLNLLKLRLSHIRENVTDLDKIYKSIYKSLQSTHDCFTLLSIMPNSGDLHSIAWGFFTENTKAWKYVCKILTKLEEIPEGKFLVTDLSTSELNAYLAYKHRL